MAQAYLENNRFELAEEIYQNELNSFGAYCREILNYWNENISNDYETFTIDNISTSLDELTTLKINDTQFTNKINKLKELLINNSADLKSKLFIEYDKIYKNNKTYENYINTILADSIEDLYIKELKVLATPISKKNNLPPGKIETRLFKKDCCINTTPVFYSSKLCNSEDELTEICLSTPYYYCQRTNLDGTIVHLGDSSLEDFKIKEKVEPGGRKLYFLSPASVYVEGDCSVIIKDQSDNILWEQPILIQKNYWPSALVNAWDGKVKIDNDNNAVMAAMMVAGEKDNNNKFSGVMLGAIQGDKENSLSQSGVYGFSAGEQSYAFKEDGTAFIGTSGSGRIYFDGNAGTIQSANYQLNTVDNNAIQGLQIDLKNGILRAEGAQLNNGIVSGKFIATEIQVGGQDFISKVYDLDEDIDLLKENLKSTSADLFDLSNKLGLKPGYNITNYLTDVGDSIFFQFGKIFGEGTDTTVEITKDGLLTASNAIIQGTIYATNGVFTGTIYAESGHIGKMNLSDGKLYAVRRFMDNGVQKYSYGGISPASSGGISSELFLVAGETDTAPNNLISDTTGLSADEIDMGYTTISNMWSSIGDHNFYVTRTGKLKATGAEIRGTIYATGGNIEGTMDVSGTLNVTGEENVSGTLNVIGEENVSGILNVTTNGRVILGLNKLRNSYYCDSSTKVIYDKDKKSINQTASVALAREYARKAAKLSYKATAEKEITGRGAIADAAQVLRWGIGLDLNAYNNQTLEITNTSLQIKDNSLPDETSILVDLGATSSFQLLTANTITADVIAATKFYLNADETRIIKETNAGTGALDGLGYSGENEFMSLSELISGKYLTKYNGEASGKDGIDTEIGRGAGLASIFQAAKYQATYSSGVVKIKNVTDSGWDNFDRIFPIGSLVFVYHNAPFSVVPQDDTEDIKAKFARCAPYIRIE